MPKVSQGMIAQIKEIFHHLFGAGTRFGRLPAQGARHRFEKRLLRVGVMAGIGFVPTLFILPPQTMCGDAVSLKEDLHGGRGNPDVHRFAPQSEGDRVEVFPDLDVTVRMGPGCPPLADLIGVGRKREKMGLFLRQTLAPGLSGPALDPAVLAFGRFSGVFP